MIDSWFNAGLCLIVVTTNLLPPPERGGGVSPAAESFNLAAPAEDSLKRVITTLNAVLFLFSGVWPRNRRKLVFGAWLGTRFADNPKYLLLHLAAQAPELDLVWIGKDDVRATMPAGLPARFVRRGSWSALYETLSAGFCFITHHTQDIALLNVLRGATVVYLGHGLALKHMGTPRFPLSSRVLEIARSAVRKAESYAFFVASSQSHVEKLLREYAINGANRDNILSTGQPRVDFLLENKASVSAEVIRAKLLSTRAIPTAQRIIAYLPTFRDKRKRAFSFLTIEGSDRERLHSLLDRHNAVILEKSHFADARREGEAEASGSRRVFGLGDGTPVDTQELLLSTDLLITDYSGCYFDYLVLNRPVLHFAYDRHYYTNSDRGLYFDLDEVAAGPVVERFEDICDQIEQELLNPDRHRERREKVRKNLMAFETGDSCRKILSAVLGIHS